MKLSVGFFASLVAADVNIDEPVKSLFRLNEFSADLLRSDAFGNKSGNWRGRWTAKFQKNANRMARNFGRKCGYYHPQIHTFKYEYDTEDACKGMKMITDGYSRWSKNHLSRCSGQRIRNHQQKRMEKWSDILSDALDCEAKASFQIYASEPSL